MSLITDDLDLSLATDEQRAVAFSEEPHDCSFIELERPEWWQAKDKTQAQQDLLRYRGRVRVAGSKLPLNQKIVHAERIIKRAMEKDVNWALSFSAGKDSTVVSHIVVERMGLKIPHMISNTRMEYPETVRQMKRWKDWLSARDVELHVAYPAQRAKEVWAKGIPLWSKQIGSKVRQFVATGNETHLKYCPAYLHDAIRAVAKAQIKVAGGDCCKALKKKPMLDLDRKLGITGHFTGVRASESEARKMAWLQRGSLYQSAKNSGMWLCHPLSFWTTEDVYAYLDQHQIELETPPRGSTGCVCCAFGAHLDQRRGEENVIQELYRNNRRMWKAAMDDWGYRDALIAAGIKILPDGVEEEEDA